MRLQAVGEPGVQVVSVSAGAPRPSVGSSAIADAGRTRATKVSRPTRRHPWRRNMASTLCAQVQRVRINPRPVAEADFYAVDARVVRRVDELRFVGLGRDDAVAQQSDPRGLWRAN